MKDWYIIAGKEKKNYHEEASFQILQSRTGRFLVAPYIPHYGMEYSGEFTVRLNPRGKEKRFLLLLHFPLLL